MGKAMSGTMKVKIAGQPTLNPINKEPPMRPRGNIMPARTKGSLVSIELKSLLRRLLILPSSAALAVKEVRRETLAKSSRITPALILQEMIGIE